MEFVLENPARLEVVQDRLRKLAEDDQSRYHTLSLLRGSLVAPGLGWALIVNADGQHEMISIEWLVELLGSSAAAALLRVNENLMTVSSASEPISDLRL